MNNVTANAATVTAQVFNLPVGTIMPFAGDLDAIGLLRETGWLFCDGKPVKKSEFPLLEKIMKGSCGSSTTEFNLPDLQGMFLRGLGTIAGHDPDFGSRTAQADGSIMAGKVLSRQTDQFKNHKHTFPNSAFPEAVFRSPGDGGYYFGKIDPRDNETREIGGNETRPKNVAVNYIIFAGMPQKAY
jgi:hypothetical protein